MLYTVKLPEPYITFYLYDGIDPDIEIEEFIMMINSGKMKLVKKKADGNCLCANPEHCLVWCLVEVSAPMIYFPTAITKPFMTY
ncbi:MAG: hypothetical protein ACJATI_002975 [Halioglobus sp.]